MRISEELAATVGVGSAEDSFNAVAGGPREGLIQARIVGGMEGVEGVEGDIVSVSYTHLTLPTICSV